MVDIRDTVTQSIHRDSHDRVEDISLEPFLFFLLQCDKPLRPSSRHCLADIQEVRIGRGQEPTRRTVTEGGRKCLAIQVPDRAMSSRHVLITRTATTTLIRDEGSKNGTFVNGKKTRSVELKDGDVIELGKTFFLYRQSLETSRAAKGDVAADQSQAVPGLLTLIPSLTAQFDDVAAVAPSTAAVVIQGPSGTGKELAARAVHTLSGRSGQFVAVNCGALTDSLVASELFGYRKGAFSGALEDRQGLIAASHRGTLFLDEIGELSVQGQTALLRALQERSVRPVGATKTVDVDLRVVAATHHDLLGLVEQEAFREDLYARLGGFTLKLPALRDRREDLGLLVSTLLTRHFGGEDCVVSLTPHTFRALFEYDWPRNIRELETSLRAAGLLAGDNPIIFRNLPEALRADRAPAAEPAQDRELTSAQLERKKQLAALLAHHGGNVSHVAEAMGKKRQQIQKWVRRYSINVEMYRKR